MRRTNSETELGNKREPANKMEGSNRTTVFGVDMPSWAGKAISAVGISTIFYGIVKYTFIGEYLEKLYRVATGQQSEAPAIDENETDDELQLFKTTGRLLRDRQN